MNPVADENKIKSFLESRYIDTILPSKETAGGMLSSGKKLTLYLGIDPTGPDIHLGHTTNLFVLKNLYQLGHKIVLLFGDFTAQTGDPTDKTATRKVLSKKEVSENVKTYKKQVQKILPPGSFEIKYNSKWFNKMNFEKIREIARKLTVQQMLNRDMFQKRIQEEKQITLEEFLYPLMQGYDSVAMEVDGEVGGSDQLFNMMVGRDLLKKFTGKEKIVITTSLLENPQTGKKLMSKSEGSYISLNDSPENMFARAMALPDAAIVPILKYTTEASDEKVQDTEKRLSKGENPRVVKSELGFELVRTYHGEKEAVGARDRFEKIIKKEAPEDTEEIKIAGKDINIIDFLVDYKIAPSRSEAKRLVRQKGLKINNQTVESWEGSISIEEPSILQVGSHRFYKIIPK